MTPLSLVVFSTPIPIPRTHRREPMFDAGDGWTIERDDAGDFHIAGHGADFWTDGFVSWVAAPLPVVERTLAIPPELQAKARKVAKQMLAPTKVQEAVRKEKLEGE